MPFRNPSDRRAWQRAYYRNQPGRLAANKLAAREKRARWRRFWLAESDRICWWCARTLTLRTFERDHVVPRNLGGGDEPENIVLACQPCNLARGGKGGIP